MKIVVVQRLDIIECVHVKGRADGTLVSLRADDRASYTVSLPRRRTPSAGGPSVAAYLDPAMKTLHAWLDPVSGEYFVADAHMPGASFFTMIAVVLLALGTMAFLGLDGRWMGAVLACLAVGSLIALAWQKVRDQRLEAVLRAALPAG